MDATSIPAHTAPGEPQGLVYRPDRGKQGGRAAIAIVLAIVIFVGRPASGVILAAILSFGLGLFLLVSAALGVPRLTLTPTGVILRTLYGTRRVAWHNLSAFAVTTTRAGRFGRRVVAGAATITSSATHPDLRKRLTIPDSFQTPITDIVADLNARQRLALGGAAVPAAPGIDEAVPLGLANTATPWVTYSILAVLLLGFVAEQIFAVEPPRSFLRPGIRTLVALGGVSRTLVASYGEWYRLFTAPLLHGDLVHIISNGVALLMAGFLLERLVGHVWFFAIFAAGALGGSLMSVAVNPANLTSVGASGAIMGMFAAAFACSFRLPTGTPERTRIQSHSVRILIPSLLPLATSTAANPVIDYGAHFGGALSGALVALFLVATWPNSARLPAFRTLAAAVAALGAVSFVGCSAAIAVQYPRYKQLSGLIPQSELPKTAAEMQAKAADLVEHYPGDPRSHMGRGLTLVTAHDLAGAERELRTALVLAGDLGRVLGPAFENTLRVMLASVLIDEGRAAEAKEAVRAACRAPAAERPTPQLQKLLADQHLCEP
jgi:rhomboid protease GluP